MRYLAVDFGSTYTKLTAVDGDKGAIVGTAAAFTTISHDVMQGFARAHDDLLELTGGFEHDCLLCCSSAAGGLAMVAVGLVTDLTAKAAKMAAESAGAKVIRTYSYEISQDEQDDIYAINPDIVLLSGGTDGGNKDIILSNARLLCDIERPFAVIAAGNKSARRELEAIFRDSGREYVITENVMPAFGKLHTEPARGCVRDIFIKRIIEAKGLSRVQKMTEHEIIPTPLSVLKACELLSLGTEKSPGIGEFLAVDLGGATTDVYSMATGEPSLDNVMVKGLPEPYAKRTVEGDLGMRYSARFLLEDAGPDAVARKASVTPEEITGWVERCSASPETLAPQNSRERAMDEALANAAVARAVERHCGLLERTYTPMGEAFMLTGKDLTEVKKVIGIGGVLVNSDKPVAILEGAAASVHTRARGWAVPSEPGYFLDSGYIFSAMGLISQVDPELALSLLKSGTKPL